MRNFLAAVGILAICYFVFFFFTTFGPKDIEFMWWMAIVTLQDHWYLFLIPAGGLCVDIYKWQFKRAMKNSIWQSFLYTRGSIVPFFAFFLFFFLNFK